MGCIDIAIQLDGVSNSERIFVGIGSTEEIIIDIFDLDGNIINRINYPHPKVMREEEQLEQISEKIANGKDFRNYKHHCSISSLGADNKNRIWVFNFAQTGNRNLMTFTESGELLNKVDLSTANCDIKILNDKMYKIVWDDDDMYSLEIYQIEG